MQISTIRPRAIVQAVLGPTNTGKTHLAMERMLAHNSGVIGFPLRLLARENYERAIKAKGRGLVALITGEEKIVPDTARYFLTTTQCMPQDRTFEFAAIDEIQMCADPERGHVFTDRLLHYRGTHETLFLGAQTIKGVIAALVPQAEFVSRPRLSNLQYTGYKKLTRLKARSCIVAFSASDVYAIAELIRRQSGGAAIVMGALSPRTRNAQVEMFQSGEVDYLVATDAVGMGLNMDVNHVALAAVRKFDGHTTRDLTPAELAQIAGRAGRHLNDGTFGVTGDVPGLEARTVKHIQDHSFARLPHIFWRNSHLDFCSLKTLKNSLAARPEHATLRRVQETEDERALEYLIRDETIVSHTTTSDGVRLLWEVACIPDFRKTHTDDHSQLLARIYHNLRSKNGYIPSDWMAENVDRLNSTEGDIDVLTGRIAAIRTWTYVSNQSTWLKEPAHWQHRTADIEDMLSDALHEKLTQRFVDRRTRILVKTLKADAPLAAALHENGDLEIEGQFLGHLSGFRFVATHDENAPADTALAAKVRDHAVKQTLHSKISERLEILHADADAAFTFDVDGNVFWRAEPVGIFTKGPSVLDPGIKVLPSDLLQSEQKTKIDARLNAWVHDLVQDRLGLLRAATKAPLHGVVRGLVYQLMENLGTLPRFEAEVEIKALTHNDRQALRKLGIRIGRHLIYLPALLRPAAVELSVLLWAVHEDRKPLAPPPAGRVSFKCEKQEPEGWLRASGFRTAGALFVRADILERISELAWKRLETAKGPFSANADFLALAGCGVDELPDILKSLGFVTVGETGTWKPRPKSRLSNHQPKKKRPQKSVKAKRAITQTPRLDPDNPFAKLRELKLK